jgi:hypothetical protein
MEENLEKDNKRGRHQTKPRTEMSGRKGFGTLTERVSRDFVGVGPREEKRGSV